MAGSVPVAAPGIFPPVVALVADVTVLEPHAQSIEPVTAGVDVIAVAKATPALAAVAEPATERT